MDVQTLILRKQAVIKNFLLNLHHLIKHVLYYAKKELINMNYTKSLRADSEKVLVSDKR